MENKASGLWVGWMTFLSPIIRVIPVAGLCQLMYTKGGSYCCKRIHLYQDVAICMMW